MNNKNELSLIFFSFPFPVFYQSISNPQLRCKHWTPPITGPISVSLSLVSPSTSKHLQSNVFSGSNPSHKYDWRALQLGWDIQEFCGYLYISFKLFIYIYLLNYIFYIIYMKDLYLRLHLYLLGFTVHFSPF